MGSTNSFILPRLYLGNVSMIDDGNLTLYGIDACLSVCADRPQKKDVEVLHFQVADIEYQSLLEYLAEGVEFILKHRLQGDTVQVHCQAGISRSCTFLTAYFMTTYNWSAEYTLDYIKKCRRCVNPNEGFRKQLDTFEKSNRDVLRQKLLAKYGDKMRNMIDQDLLSVKAIENGEERNFILEQVNDKPEKTIEGMHSTQSVDDLLQMAKRYTELKGDCDLFLLNGEESSYLEPSKLISELSKAAECEGGRGEFGLKIRIVQNLREENSIPRSKEVQIKTPNIVPSCINNTTRDNAPNKDSPVPKVKLEKPRTLQKETEEASGCASACCIS